MVGWLVGWTDEEEFCQTVRPQNKLALVLYFRCVRIGFVFFVVVVVVVGAMGTNYDCQ